MSSNVAVNSGATLTTSASDQIAGNHTINGTLNLGGDDSIASLAGSGSVVNGGNNLTIQGGAIFSGVISGTGDLIKSNVGTQTLTGVNTYTGATNVTGGTLAIGTGGSINDSTVVGVQAGATLTTADADSLADTAAVTSAGALTIGGNDTINTLTINNGTTTLNAAVTATTSVDLTGGVLDASGGSLTTTAFAQTGGILNPVGTPADLDGANVDSNFTVIALGGVVTANGATGIDATGAMNGDVLVQTSAAGVAADGIITAVGTDHGISTTASGTGNTSINLGDNIVSTASSGDGIHVVSGAGDVTISGTGDVTANPSNAGSDGIDIQSMGGQTTITLEGNISGDPGVVYADAAGGSFTQMGVGDITGAVAEGVLATTTGGDGDIVINQDGNIEGATTGVNVITSNVGNSGNGTATVIVQVGHTIEGLTAIGVATLTDNGSNTVTADGEVTGQTIGIRATIKGTGNITIDGDGNVIGTTNDGILAFAAEGGNVNISGDRTVTGGADGVVAFATDDGTIVVVAGDVVTGNDGFGVLAAGQNGDVTVTADADINGTDGGVNANTLNVGAATGNITVDGDSNIAATDIGEGISAKTDRGGITISGAGNTTGMGAGAESAAVDADIFNSEAGTHIVIDRSGNYVGEEAGGIIANNAGLGNIDIDTGTGTVIAGANSAVTVSGSAGILGDATTGNVTIKTMGVEVTGGHASVDGIRADTSEGGEIEIVANGDVTITGTGDAGIQTNAGDRGVTDITLAAGVTVTGLNEGIDADTTMGGSGAAVNIMGGAGSSAVGGTGSAIDVDAQDGAVKVTGEISATSTDGDGIQVDTTGGDITVDTTGDVTSTNADGIDANSTTGDVKVASSGTITANNGTGIDATSGGGDVTVDQAGGTIAPGVNIGIIAVTTGNGRVDVTANDITTDFGGGCFCELYRW